MLQEEGEEEDVGRWIGSEESAKEMMGRVLKERPLLILPPPLHRVPLRVGNVVEIVGPSGCAKTLILIQAAVTCILPKEYGGLERLVFYLDLDSRFDIQRLSQSLRHRILQHHAFPPSSSSDQQLFLSCMSRFFCVPCYTTVQFLATLKTLHYQIQKESKRHGVGAHFLMIDSINAFYWIDRASTPVTVGSHKRKNMSLHIVVENIVQEMQKLLQVQPMLLLATKATILGDASNTSDLKRKFRKSASNDTTDLLRSRASQKHSYREYMPSSWQQFITHRILIHMIADEDPDKSKQTYVLEWLLPSPCHLDKFRVSNAGINMVT